jgi:hypothetical protein
MQIMKKKHIYMNVIGIILHLVPEKKLSERTLSIWNEKLLKKVVILLILVFNFKSKFAP